MASAKVIPPGGEGQINVSFKSKGRRGKQTKTITVMSDDPDQPNFKLSITAEVAIKFGFERPKLGLGQIKKDDLQSKSIEFIGEDLGKVKIQSMAISNSEHEKYYSYKLSDSGEGDARKLVLEISPTASLPIGRFRDELIITTDQTDLKEVTLHLSGEMLGPIEIMPRALMMRSESDTAPFVGSVSLKPTKEDIRFNVISAECKDPGPTVTVHRQEPDGTVKIEMSLPADFSGKSFRSELTVITDLPEQKKTMIPVYSSPRRPVTRNGQMDTKFPGMKRGGKIPDSKKPFNRESKFKQMQAKSDKE